MRNYNYEENRFEMGPVKIFDGNKVYTLARGFTIAKPEVASHSSFVSIKDKAGRRPNIAEETYMMGTYLQNENRGGSAYFVNEADIVKYTLRGGKPKVGLVVYNRQKYMWQLLDAITERASALHEVAILEVYASYFSHPEYLALSCAEIEKLQGAVPSEGSESPAGKENSSCKESVDNIDSKSASSSGANGQDEEPAPKSKSSKAPSDKKGNGSPTEGPVQVFVDYMMHEDETASWAYKLVSSDGKRVITNTKKFPGKGNNNYYIIASTVIALTKIGNAKDITLYTRDEDFNKVINQGLLTIWENNNWRKKFDNKPLKNTQVLKALQLQLTRLGSAVKAEYMDPGTMNLFAN